MAGPSRPARRTPKAMEVGDAVMTGLGPATTVTLTVFDVDPVSVVSGAPG